MFRHRRKVRMYPPKEDSNQKEQRTGLEVKKGQVRVTLTRLGFDAIQLFLSIGALKDALDMIDSWDKVDDFNALVDRELNNLDLIDVNLCLQNYEQERMINELAERSQDRENLREREENECSNTVEK